MTKTGGSNLEERVRKRRVAILDDNESDRLLIERHLRKAGESDGVDFEFISSNNPNQIVNISTQDTSIDAVIADLFLSDTPNEMKAKFGNGLDALHAIKEIRGDSIYNVLISGTSSLPEEYRGVIESLLGKGYVESIAKANYVDARWAKSGKRENMRKLYEILKTAILKNDDPRFPRVYVVAGDRAAGKTSTAGRVCMVTPGLRAIPTAATRELRKSDLVGKGSKLYSRLEHLFASKRGIYDLILRAGEPLIWTNRGDVLTREQCIAQRTNILNDPSIQLYMLDLEKTESTLGERHDGMVATSFPRVIEAIRTRFGERSFVVYLKASERSRRERLYKDGRPIREIEETLDNMKKNLDPEFRRLAHATINTDISYGRFRTEYGTRRAIDEVQRRILNIISFLRKTPYGTSTSKINAGYVNSVERAFTGKRYALETGQTVEIPLKVQEGYANTLSADLRTLNMILGVSHMEVMDVKIEDGVKRVRLVPQQLIRVDELVRDEEPWKNTLAKLVEYHLEQKGFKAAASRTSSLVYGLTDVAEGSGVHSLHLSAG